MKKEEAVDKIYEKLETRMFFNKNLNLLDDQSKILKDSDYDKILNQLFSDLENANKLWDIQSEKQIKSHRKVTGKYIVLGKKIIRKLLRWYISPIIREQNMYNSYSTRTLNDIKVLIEKLVDDNKKYHEEIKKVSEYDLKEIKKLNDCLASCENKVSWIWNLISEDERLKYYINTLSKENDKIIFEDAIESFEKRTQRLLNESNEDNRPIIIMCRNYKVEGNIEAIKKESYELFKVLRTRIGNRVRFISLEESGKLQENNEIYYVPEQDLIKHLSDIKPKVIHIFESNPHILFSQNCELLKFNVLFSITGMEPFPGLASWAIDELKHFNDNNKIKFIVESEYTKKVFEKHGFKEPYLMYPFIDMEDIKYRKQSSEGFTVGFASSPMKNDQIINRGVELLAKLIIMMPKVKFKIAWRNSEVPVPREFLEYKNVEVLYGMIDMNEFYNSIECTIIPYLSTENNHACSLSAIESIIRGIPVICTNIAGVSEVINITGAGIIADANAQGLEEAIMKVQYNSIDSNYDKIMKLFNDEEKINKITKIYKSFNSESLPMLKKWDESLKEHGKYLVKGNSNIKSYYEQQSIAENYNADRFEQFPMNLYNAFEKKAVNIIIQKEFEGKQLSLLDIATGDGRILGELTRYGEVTALDNSHEMLKIVQSKFSDSNVNLIQGDYLEDELQNKYDVITTFRYIRHFQYEERKKIYSRIKNNLKDDGLFIFDVPNIEVELKLREIDKWSNFNIYDVFWTKESIKEELEMNGFKIKYIIPVGESLISNLPKEYKEKTLVWTLGVSKN